MLLSVEPHLPVGRRSQIYAHYIREPYQIQQYVSELVAHACAERLFRGFLPR